MVLDTTQIVLIVLASVLVAILLIALIVWAVKRHRRYFVSTSVAPAPRATVIHYTPTTRETPKPATRTVYMRVD
jgi:hypothetical protein